MCVCVCVCVLFSLFVNWVSVCVCVCVQLLRPDWEQRLFRSGTHHANLSNILNWLCNWVLRRGCKQKTSLAFFFPSLCVCVCVCVWEREQFRQLTVSDTSWCETRCLILSLRSHYWSTICMLRIADLPPKKTNPVSVCLEKKKKMSGTQSGKDRE